MPSRNRTSVGAQGSSQINSSDSDDDVPLINRFNRSGPTATQSTPRGLVLRLTNPMKHKATSRKRKVKHSTKKEKKGLQVSRGSGFSAVETSSLLELLHEHLPIGNSEWEHILTLHDRNFSDKMRTVDSLKRKFATLHRKKIPTGNPIMPDDVLIAKNIRSKITERSEIGNANDFSDEFSDDSKDSSEDDEVQFNNSGRHNSNDENDEVELGGNEDDIFSSQPGPNSNDESGTRAGGAPRKSSPSFNAVRSYPRPLVHRRTPTRSKKDDEDDILSLLKAQIVMDGMRKEEEHKRREQERLEREEERKAERVRHEEDKRLQDRMLQMMMMAMMKGNPAFGETDK